MKILLLGKDGQVGWELQRALAPLGDVAACDRSQADLADPDMLRSVVRAVAPDVIVNAAAYTAVDKAESEPELAQRINADAVAVLAEAARARGAWLLHFSTDYVFAGDKSGPYVEDDAAGPQSVYGHSKLAGEQAIRNSGCRHLLFRTSWVYAARGGNFARTMLRLAGEREELKVVADQHGAPTSAELIADVSALCLARLAHDRQLAELASGTYHLVASGETTWHAYAGCVIAEARRLGWPLRVDPARVLPIATEAYPLPARRPKNSRLSTAKLRERFGLCLPDWTFHLRRMLAELRAEGGS